MKSIAIKVGVVLLVIIMIAGVYFLKQNMRPDKSVEDVAKNIREGKMINFVEENCYACKKMEGLMKEVIAEYQNIIEISEVDVMENQALAQKYNIRYTPTQVFLDKDGNEIERHEGFIGKKDLVEKLSKLGVNK